MCALPSSPQSVARRGGDASESPPAFGITSTAWVPLREFDLAEWSAVGRRLGAMGRCGQWGLGDWIRYGNVKFGERYSRAARITGYDPQTLMNMVYVASRFEVSRRREAVSWSHHESLAALDAGAQDYWLDRAAAEKMSVIDLRTELRSARRRLRTQADAEQRPPAARPTLTCPHCRKPIFLSRADVKRLPRISVQPRGASPAQ